MLTVPWLPPSPCHIPRSLPTLRHALRVSTSACSYELELLQDKAAVVLSMKPSSEPTLPPVQQGGSWGWGGSHGRHWQYGSSTSAKFEAVDVSAASEQWVTQVQGYLREELAYRK